MPQPRSSKRLFHKGKRREFVRSKPRLDNTLSKIEIPKTRYYITARKRDNLTRYAEFS